MNDWVVESPSFIEDLMNNRIVYLNQKGINEVVEIINNKDKEIERLKEEIKGYEQERERVLNIIAERNRKAIEYIENEMPCLWEVDDIWEDIDGNYQHNYKEYDTQILLDKLKGVDE